MRELKFRAWHKDAHWMRPVADISFSDRLVSVRMEEDSPARGPYLTVPLAEVALMQWTGMVDRDGIEIYEGDRVQVHWPTDENTYAIIWNPDAGLYQCSKLLENGQRGFWYMPEHFKEMEVIGTIYEHSELLR